MTLERIEHKVFASEAPLDEMGQFGSALATTKLNTKDVAEIQALPAYTKGWGSAIISENNYPAMEEMNGVLNVMSYHTGYLYQEGIPVYSSAQTYSTTSMVKSLDGKSIYRSLKGDNKGNPLEDGTSWELFDFSKGSLKTNQITNCLLEVPQRIKLELNDGVLTLKAGSEVIVPNGFKEDGTTPKFDYVTIEKDIIIDSGSATTDVTYVIFANADGQGWNRRIPDNSLSGTSDPGTQGTTYYNITTNILISHNASEDVQVGLPIAICTALANGAGWNGIDQVFNGFGYMGSIVWVDKGVKGLIPNGRNSDGTLNNIEFTTSSMMRVSARLDNTGIIRLGINDKTVSTRMNGWTFVEQDEQPKTENITNYTCWYSPKDNIYRDTSNKGATWSQAYYTFPVWYFGDTTRVTSLHYKEPFRAVDYNDFAKVESAVNNWVPSYIRLSSATAVGNYTIDLSTILPDDGHMYELLVSYRAYYSGDSYANGLIHITNEYLQEVGDEVGYMTAAGDKYQEDAAASGVIPIGASRSFTFKIKVHGFNSMALMLHSYRKLGKY